MSAIAPSAGGDAWIDGLAADADARALRPPPGSDSGERAHCFGDELFGVLHHASGRHARDTAVILFNAGMVHRSGPYRGAVQLARALAADGYAVLRFDQCGLGDSPVASAALADRAHRELCAAMDLLTATTGLQRFVIGGICSAADRAFRLAALEARVHGLLLFDGLAYRTAGYWWRYLPQRLLHPAKLWRWWRQRGTAVNMANFRDFPARRDAVAQMAALVSREVRMLFVFTGGAYRYFNHAAQLAACLGSAARSPQVSLSYWPDCDHTFYLKRDRARLQVAVLAWLASVAASVDAEKAPPRVHGAAQSAQGSANDALDHGRNARSSPFDRTGIG